MFGGEPAGADKLEKLKEVTCNKKIKNKKIKIHSTGSHVVAKSNMKATLSF
jgi:hypothetical protein